MFLLHAAKSFWGRSLLVGPKSALLGGLQVQTLPCKTWCLSHFGTEASYLKVTAFHFCKI